MTKFDQEAIYKFFKYFSFNKIYILVSRKEHKALVKKVKSDKEVTNNFSGISDVEGTSIPDVLR